MSQRRIAINLSANLGAQLFSKLFPIIAYAYAQRKIGTVAFGHALFAISLVDWSGAGIEIGSTAYGQIQVGQGSEDRTRMRSLLGGILTVRLINAVVAALILFFAVRTYYADYEQSVMALSFMMLSTVSDMAYIQVGTKSLWRLGLLNVLSKCVVLALLMLLVQDSSDATMFAVLVAGANSAVSFATFYIGVKKWRPSRPAHPDLRRLLPPSRLPLCAVVPGLGAAGDRHHHRYSSVDHPRSHLVRQLRSGYGCCRGLGHGIPVDQSLGPDRRRARRAFDKNSDRCHRRHGCHRLHSDQTHLPARIAVACGFGIDGRSLDGAGSQAFIHQIGRWRQCLWTGCHRHVLPADPRLVG